MPGAPPFKEPTMQAALEALGRERGRVARAIRADGYEWWFVAAVLRCSEKEARELAQDAMAEPGLDPKLSEAGFVELMRAAAPDCAPKKRKREAI